MTTDELVQDVAPSRLGGEGAILAGVLTPRLRRRFGFGICWIGGLCGTGLGLLAFALTGSMPLIVMISTLQPPSS